MSEEKRADVKRPRTGHRDVAERLLETKKDVAAVSKLESGDPVGAAHASEKGQGKHAQ